MTGREIRDIQIEKGAMFTAEFIKRFDREWGEVREAARQIRERQGSRDGKGKMD